MLSANSVGSIFKSNEQLSVFTTDKTPCYVTPVLVSVPTAVINTMNKSNFGKKGFISA